MTGTYRNNHSTEMDRGKEFNLQAAHLPRKAPKETLPMPVADTQKQNKCSRNRVSALQRRFAAKRKTQGDKGEKRRRREAIKAQS